MDEVITGYATVGATGTISGTKGSIVLYKYDSGEINPLADAQFTLEASSLLYVDSQITTGTGYAKFDLSTSGYAGTYTLTEDVPPEGYAKLKPIEIEINTAGEIIAVNGETIPENAANGTAISDTDGNVIWPLYKVMTKYMQ